MNLIEIQETGARVVGALTPLGFLGPSHHGTVIGMCPITRQVYVVEKRVTSTEINTFEDFEQRYKDNGSIKIRPNTGKFSNLEVARRALEELNKGGEGEYSLLVNNCESAVNRAIYNTSLSLQVLSGLAFLGVAGYLLLKGGTLRA